MAVPLPGECSPPSRSDCNCLPCKVEGIISLILAPITYFWIPNRIDEAWFLNAEQKRLAAVRYEINKAHYNHKEQFQWSEVLRGITDWKVGR